MPPMPSVARGLKLARLGMWWVVVTVTAATLGLFAGGMPPFVNMLGKFPNAREMYLYSLIGIACLAPVGFVIAFVGRCFCLASPPELPPARARVGLAVLLEACGWLSAVVNVAVGTAIAFRVVPLPMIAVAVTGGVSLLLLAAGRVQFLRYTRSLADQVAPTLTRPSARSLALFVTTVACVALGFGFYQLANHSPPASSLGYALSGGFIVTAVVTGIAHLFVYGRLLRRLRQAVNTPHTLDVREPEPDVPATPPEHALVA
jgi:hypothetical protein